MKEIYQLIGDFDSLAIRYASEHPQQEDILAELRENLEQSGRRDISISDWNAYSDEFHLIFYKYCRNSRLVSSAEQLRCQLSILAYQYANESQKRIDILQEHKDIFHLYEAGKFPEAANRMKEHLLHSLRYAEKLVSE